MSLELRDLPFKVLTPSSSFIRTRVRLVCLFNIANDVPLHVLLPIEGYKKILAILDKVEDHKETKLLSQSEEFKKLVKKALGDIALDRIRPWKEVWDEL